MTTRLRGDSADDVERAASLLRDGKLVAFPTETVYGLGAHGLDEDAVRRVFAVKGRPADNPVILHVASFEQARALWDASDEQLERAQACAEAFWPGPLTLVLPAAPHVPSVVTAGLGSVGVRVPRHDVALAVLTRAGVPVAAPSANRSGRPSPTSAAHVLRTLDERVDAVLDGGETDVGLESTVLDLTRQVPAILRPGMVGRAALRRVLGDVDELSPASGAAAASPGLRHRHYAPSIASVALVPRQRVEEEWRSSAALLLLEDTAAHLERALGPRRAPLERLPEDPDRYAHGLYAALYRLEATGAERLLVEAVPDDERWTAVRDRVQRATGAR